MSSWNGFRRAIPLWMAMLVVVSVFTGCEPQPGVAANGSAELQVSLAQGLSAADVTGVRVEVRGPGISSLTTELAKAGSAWQGTLAIPAGTDRVFEASAYDAAGTVLYRGSSSPVSIASGSTVSVVLTLQQVSVPPPYQNEPPVIDSVVVSSNTVLPGGTITLAVTAHDPNGDALSFAWTANGGTFSSPAAPSTSWTAPATEGVHRLQLEVTDSKGTSTAVNFDISVQRDGATGDANVSIGFNTWPEIRAMKATPAILSAGGTTALSVSAVDAEGDALSYLWSTDCGGAISDVSSAAPSFTLGAGSSASRCTFQVAVSDGRGGQHTGTLILQVGNAPHVNVAPKIDTFSQNATSAAGGQVVTFGVTGHDPEGKAVVFSWSTSSGSLRTPRWTTGSSEVDWVAPACFDNPVSIVATVTDADGASVQYTFSIAPIDSAKCGPLAVSGVRNLHYIQADGSVLVAPVDLSLTVIGAWVPSADGSTYTYRSGTGQTNGTFVIPNVDRTPYFLQFGSGYVWMNSRSLDLSSATLGRPDVAQEPAGTQLSLQLDGISPWQLSDDVQLHSTGAGLGYFSATCGTPYLDIPEGSPAYVGTIDYVTSMRNCGSVPAVLDPARGDSVFANQLVSRTDTDAGIPSGLDLQEVRFSTKISSVARSADGGTGTITLGGMMMPLPTSRQNFDFRASQFEALAMTAHPSALSGYDSVYMDTLPRFSEYGAYAGSPDLALANNSTQGQGDIQVSFQYGNPFPGEWPRFVVAQASSYVPFSVGLADGGTSRPAYYTANVSSQVQVLDGVPQTLVPQLGPVRDMRLNGLSATTALTGVGTTPLVSWTLPSLGTPTLYSVRLYELAATSSGGTSRTSRGSFTTTNTQFRLPPGLLVAGKNYMLQLYAYYEPGYNPNQPYMNVPTLHYAVAFSSSFQP